VARFLLQAGYEVRREVAFLSKRIDLAGVLPRKGTVIAIEAKVRDWSGGLRQAVLYRLCADEVFLALSARYVHNVDRNLLTEFGVGLLLVDGTARIEIRAHQSPVTHRKFADKVRQYVLRE